MMTSNRPAALSFESHPSLSASLEDFESNENPSPAFFPPSHHSGFKAESSEVDAASDPDEPWSPPAWKRSDNGSAWYRHQPYAQISPSPRLRFSGNGSKSREGSPTYESADEDKEDYTIPANIPLPRGSLSPAKDERSPSPVREVKAEPQPEVIKSRDASAAREDPNNYIRFSVRADVQHRTESFETALSALQQLVTAMAQARVSYSVLTLSLLSMVILITLGRILFQPLPERPMPDLVKVAGLASSYEPLLVYSEKGMQQTDTIRQTSVALWDLAETVRGANLESAPTMSKELDGLSDSLNKLSEELNKFFAKLNGDIDGILLVMDWAKAELSVLPAEPPNVLSTVLSNIHTICSRVGILENSAGNPTAVGDLVTGLFGRTYSQQTRFTLQRTFVELIGILEESVDNELTHSNNLFSLFNIIEIHFNNLQRTTARASDNEERLESEFFDRLWTRLLGANAGKVRKFEKNKALLHNVRAKTLLNKNMLVENNHRLVALKQNLESLRRMLLSPLVQGGQGSTVRVEDQIMRLDNTYQHLKRVRKEHENRVMGGTSWHENDSLLGVEGHEYMNRHGAIGATAS